MPPLFQEQVYTSISASYLQMGIGFPPRSIPAHSPFHKKFIHHSFIKNPAMAKIDSLPFNLSGQLGDYVYYKWKGKNVVRKRPAPRKTELSPAELKLRSQ